MKNIKLTEKQQKYLPAIQWLLDDTARAEGRSYLLAVAFLQKAVVTGDWVFVFDHYASKDATRHLMQAIHDIVSSDEELLERAEFRDTSFRIK